MPTMSTAPTIQRSGSCPLASIVPPAPPTSPTLASSTVLRPTGTGSTNCHRHRPPDLPTSAPGLLHICAGTRPVGVVLLVRGEPSPGADDAGPRQVQMCTARRSPVPGQDWLGRACPRCRGEPRCGRADLRAAVTPASPAGGSYRHTSFQYLYLRLRGIPHGTVSHTPFCLT